MACSRVTFTSIKYSECVCRQKYSAWNVRASYCHLRAVRLYYIFTRYYRHQFRKKKKKCFDFPYNVCRKHFSFWEEMSMIWYKMCIGLRVKYRLFLSCFNEANVLGTFSINTHLQSPMKICPLGAESDRRTGMTKLSRFLQVCERACRWLCAVPCLCHHLVVASVATGSDCLLMSSSGAEDKPWKLIVKSQTPTFSRLFKIAICERE